MSLDLAALAPSVIVCVAFLIGGWMLLRRELAPRPAAGPRPMATRPVNGHMNRASEAKADISYDGVFI